MIDTIKIITKSITESDYNLILSKDKTITRQGIENGNKVYSFTSGTFEFSSFYGVTFRLKDFIYKNIKDKRTGKRITQKVTVPFYIEFEFSLTKYFKKTNAKEGISDITLFLTVIENFNSFYGTDLPLRLCFYELHQIDIAENFKLESYDTVTDYIKSLSVHNYSRRKVSRYDDNTGLHIPGSTTTLKIYAKGPEYKKHDYKKIKKESIKYNNYETLCFCTDMLDYSESVLRFESSVKKIKLQNLSLQVQKNKIRYSLFMNYFSFFVYLYFCFKITFENFFQYILSKIILQPSLSLFDFVHYTDNFYFFIYKTYRKDFSTLLREGAETSQKYLNDAEILNILTKKDDKNGAILYGFYSILKIYGESKARSLFPKSTFYRNIGLLRAYGIVWDTPASDGFRFSPFCKRSRKLYFIE